MADLFISTERAEADVLDCAAFLAERIKSADGHASAMAEIIPRYLARGEVDLAAELSNAVDDPFLRDNLLILAAEKCAEIDDDEYAMQLAEAIEDHGLAAQVIERVALVFAAKGEADKALMLSEQLDHPDQIFAGVALDLTARGEAARADEVLAKIEFPSARVGALQHMAAEAVGNGIENAAVAHLDRALADTAEIEHPEERLRAVCDIGSLFIDAGRRDKAIEAFGEARDLAERLESGHRDYFLANAALGFLHAGSDELCERCLDLITDKTQMASSVLGIARVKWRRGEQDEAVDELEDAWEILRTQRDIETRDSRARNALAASVAVQFAGFSRFERAMEVAELNQDPMETAGALNQIAQVATTLGRDDEAAQALAAIIEDADRLAALLAVSDAKKRLDTEDAAVRLLGEAEALAESVPQLTSRAAALNEIAGRYAAYGLLDEARKAVASSMEVIATIRDESSRATALAELADVFAATDLDISDDEKTHLGRFAHSLKW